MECKIYGKTKFYCDGKLVGETNYNGNAFADPFIEITEEDIAMAYNDYLKHHPEAWQALADKLWDSFVDYKDVPLGDKEVWHEQKN